MAALDVINLVSAALSTVLSIVALWLALYLYRMSNDQFNRAQQSATDMAATVAKLEDLFNRLYDDTFSMMRDTLTDMRAHIWPASGSHTGLGDVLEQAERTAKDRMKEARSELLSQIATSSKQAGITESSVSSILDDLGPVVDRALDESSEAGAVRSAKIAFISPLLRAHLLAGQRESAGQFLGQLVSALHKYGFQRDDVINALSIARDEGWVAWSGNPGQVDDGTLVHLIEAPEDFDWRGSRYER
jgi:hypothetical protein